MYMLNFYSLNLISFCHQLTLKSQYGVIFFVKPFVANQKQIFDNSMCICSLNMIVFYILCCMNVLISLTIPDKE